MPEGPLHLVRFQPRHHFLAFTVADHRLVFSGGDPLRTETSPEIYAYDWTTGTEALIARALDPSASIVAVAAEADTVVFVETYPAGPAVSRVRAVSARGDVVLDQLVLDDPTTAAEFRTRIGVPMVALAEGLAVWSSAEAPDAYSLNVQHLGGGSRVVLRRSREWIGYPRASHGTVVFSEGLQTRTVWVVKVGSGAPASPLLSETDVSEPAVWNDSVVMKKAGRDAFDPAGLQLCKVDGTDCEGIVPTSALAWEPTIGYRYVVWQGSNDSVPAYDLIARKVVHLAEAEKDGQGRIGVVGRAAIYGDVIVWLSSPPGDITQTANLKPVFNLLVP